MKEYQKSNIKLLLPFLTQNIIQSKKYLNNIYYKLFSPFLKNEINLLFNRDKNKKITNEEIENLNKQKDELNKKLQEMFDNCNLIPLLNIIDKDIKKIFEEYENNADQKINKKEIEDVINEINKKIEKKLNNFIKNFKKENEKISKQIKEILNVLEAKITQSMSKQEMDLQNIKKLTNVIFDNINKGLLFGLGTTGTIVGGLICEYTGPISFGALGGGIIGVILGAFIGGIMIGIRAWFNYENKTKDFLKLLKESQIQYNSIYEGIIFNVKTKIEETRNIIKNLINYSTNFLNKRIDSIRKEEWNKTKNELMFISDKFDVLFERDSNSIS